MKEKKLMDNEKMQIFMKIVELLARDNQIMEKERLQLQKLIQEKWKS